MERVILAIDPGTRGAFAWGQSEASPASWQSEPFHFPKGRHPGERALAMCEGTRQLLLRVGPSAVFYEEAFPLSRLSQRCAFGLYAAVEMACCCLQAPVLLTPVFSVNVRTWQAWAIPEEWRPKGRMTRERLKPLVRRAAYERFQAPAGLTEDEYEARCILAWAHAHVSWKKEV